MNGSAFFKAIGDQRISGGCEDCAAYQTLDSSQAPLYRLVVHHDETCPTFRAMGGTR